MIMLESFFVFSVQSLRLSSMESTLTDSNSTSTELLSRLRVGEEQLEDLRTKNRELELRLSVSEKHLEDLKTEHTVHSVQLSLLESRLTDNNNSALELRLRVSETQLDDLRTAHTVQEAELSAVTFRLNVTEEQVDELRTQNTVGAAELRFVSDRATAAQREAEVLQVQLTAGEAAVNQLKAKSEELELRLRVSEKQLEDLRTESTDQLKVAFSAGLTDSGSVGPFDEETTLIFSKTICNIGQAYNQTAGVFTAPVRGVYFFSFTAADYLKGYMGLYLYRNNQPIIFNLNLNDHGGYASMSNAVALQLEEGDQVRLSLPASYRLYDDSRNFSVFSGFLLFPL
ncbi:uncharacterized protein LOC121197089 isoform X2 [Toxotes jaculatrix]|uniref:uncharacterized protein LOC121197089 isoform X2 n=1 Tax=Toxotes jaculatrix TaxID=941984 RepID=UPI001B3AA49C|nr:uncharacterized protein LOC121197089 isoform X2 [Toxotes jaculatrix]